MPTTILSVQGGRFPQVRTIARGKLILIGLLVAASTAASSEQPPVRVDRHGDPLPAGAVARLGTVRWRHGFYVHALAYSPDGKKIAAGGIGRPLTLWDTATGKEVCPFPDGEQSLAVAFSPDSKLLASADASICHLWDAANGKELRQLKGHTKTVCGIAFASDGKALATVSEDGTARFWDAKDGKELRRLDCNQGSLNAVAYSPDDKLVATAGNDGTIRLWNPGEEGEGRALKGHAKAAWKLAFSPDGTRVASSGADGTIRLWDIVSGRPLRVLGEKLGLYNLPIAFTADGALLAAGVGEGLIRLWDTASGDAAPIGGMLG